MDAPSQNMNALSVQSLYFAGDDALHEIDLRLLSRLPETLQLLQDQLRRLGAEPEAPPAPPASASASASVVETVAVPSFSRRAAAAAAPAVAG